MIMEYTSIMKTHTKEEIISAIEEYLGMKTTAIIETEDKRCAHLQFNTPSGVKLFRFFISPRCDIDSTGTEYKCDGDVSFFIKDFDKGLRSSLGDTSMGFERQSCDCDCGCDLCGKI